ncbi:MAG: hypothetical protein Q7R95_11610 [bacterium]|nr:hypothetical protein [bacterium]
MLDMNLRTKFLRIYANLPLNQRNEIVVVLDDEPMTWNAVRVEIENDTEKGKEILKKLIDLQIIK